mgnify:CR=1 FL=1
MLGSPLFVWDDSGGWYFSRRLGYSCWVGRPSCVIIMLGRPSILVDYNALTLATPYSL